MLHKPQLSADVHHVCIACMLYSCLPLVQHCQEALHTDL